MTTGAIPASPAKAVCLTLLIAMLMYLLPATLYAQDEATIRIRCTPEEKMFPKKWYGKKIDARAEALDTSLVDRVEKVLKKALEKYPANVTSQYIDRIYVFRSLRFYGFPYGGTYSRKTIYLIFDPSNQNHTDRSLEISLHHELSSILWKENMKQMKPKEWMALNPPGFTYGEGGANAIRSGVASMNYEPGLYMIGFINDYSLADLEQDINVYAQNLFSGGEPFWKIADANPAVLAKARRLAAFYNTIDSIFTESYFRAVR